MRACNFDAFPPPPSVCRRAWECAYVVTEEYLDSLADHGSIGVAINIVRAGPDSLTWGQTRAAFCIYGDLVEVRT